MRCFIALPLPEDTRARLAVVQYLLPLPAEVPPRNMHLTLCFLGDQNAAVLDELHMAMEALAMPGFSIVVQGLGIFGGGRPRAVYAGVAPEPALDRLQRKVETAARRAGASGLPARRFKPHVTLGRFQPQEADVPRLERAVAEQMPLRLAPFAVEAFVLYESRLTRSGPQYDELARYHLRQ